MIINESDLNLKYNARSIALIFASRASGALTVELLLKHGADINSKNGFDKTAPKNATDRGYDK